MSRGTTAIKCKTCERMRRRDAGESPPWDAIHRGRGWDVVHAYGTAVEGWTVLVVRRHITAVADLTDEEASELGPLIRDVSRAIQAVLSCKKTYVVQFAEHPFHPHVHVHVIPRLLGLPKHFQGPQVFDLLGVAEEASVSEERMNEFAVSLRSRLSATVGITP